jgi:large subunit ribosomal protein L24
MRKIRKGDQVIVTSGKDKGAKAQVKLVSGNKVLLEGINIVKKHTKPNPQKGIEGGIVSKAMPVDISNVAILNSATQKADKIGIRFLEDGKKVRFLKSNSELLDV